MSKFASIVVICSVLFAVVLHRLLRNATVATFGYIVVSYLLNFDGDQVFTQNTEGEVEDGIYVHRFVHIDRTFNGLPVNATYHMVECGPTDGEAIVFGHGLGENWRVWKDIMRPFCDQYRAIAVDSEGMGQSTWDTIFNDLPKENSPGFMADMEMQALRQLDVTRFNLVNTDYTFWTNLAMLVDYGDDVILRYVKIQSTVGIEDVKRIPQGVLFKNFPTFMDWLVNLNPYALTRVLFGKALLQSDALESNKRISQPLSDAAFNEVIMTGLKPGGLTPWVYFYHYGRDMIQQMEYQIDVFRKIKYPVSMLQGFLDKGQPKELFDGSAVMSLVEEPAVSTRDKILRSNHTHKLVTSYSPDGSVIGPSPESFFPNSPWVKFRFLSEIGHFAHMEAPQDVIDTIREILAVPVA